jgi:hypothetical protein
MAFTGTKINTLYYNDLHSSIKYVDTFLEKQDEFYRQNSDEINLTLCGGDMFLDENSNNEIVAEKLGPKTDALSVGNHDLEQGEQLATIIDKYGLQGKFLSTNLKYTKTTPLSSIPKSRVIEKQGERIGIIGVSPFDFNHITFMNTLTDFIQVKPLDETIKIIKNEVKKLEKNGIDPKKYMVNMLQSYDAVMGKGKLPLLFRKRFEYDKTDQYISAKQQHPMLCPGPGNYWDDGKAQFKKEKNEDGERKRYVMTSDKTYKRLYVPCLRKSVF